MFFVDTIPLVEWKLGEDVIPLLKLKSQKSALFRSDFSLGSLLNPVENTNVIFFYLLPLFKIKKHNEKYVISLLLK